MRYYKDTGYALIYTEHFWSVHTASDLSINCWIQCSKKLVQGTKHNQQVTFYYTNSIYYYINQVNLTNLVIPNVFSAGMLLYPIWNFIA